MKVLLLIVWMICTIILSISIIGMVLFIPDTYTNQDNTPSTWMQVGRKLVNKIIEE